MKHIPCGDLFNDGYLNRSSLSVFITALIITSSAPFPTISKIFMTPSGTQDPDSSSIFKQNHEDDLWSLRKKLDQLFRVLKLHYPKK